MSLIVIALVVGGEAAKQGAVPGSTAEMNAAQATTSGPASQGTGLQKTVEDNSDISSMPVEIQQIVKMVRATVPEAVIQSYVQNSTAVVAPSADDLIYLRQHGITSAVMAALIQRSKDLEERGNQRQNSGLNGSGIGTAPAPGLSAGPMVIAYVIQPQAINPASGFYPSYPSRAYYGGYPVAGAYTTGVVRQNVAPNKSNRTSTGLQTVKSREAVAQSERAGSYEGRADRISEQLKTVMQERDDARRQLAAWEAVVLPPDQVRGLAERLNKTERERQAVADANAELRREKSMLEARLARFDWRSEREPVMRTGVKAKVLALDPKWGFVVLNIGSEQGAVERGELLVHRDGRFIAKVKVVRTESNRCIANILPESQGGEIMEGDEAFH
jgi:hypothetical protein